MQCNIDARGKVFRLIGGGVTVLVAVAIATLVLMDVLTGGWWWLGAGLLATFGVFGIYEARMGWCVLRAMGIKTRF